jgi:DNA-binding SARP family transcriptional activator
LSVICDGQPITSLQGRKGRDLLSYLVLRHGVPHARERLAALFWGQRDDQHARHCFNTALWRLQTALGGKGSPARRWLQVDAQAVSFCPDITVFVDVIEFERRCELAAGLPATEVDRRAALLCDAVALYRGDLLTDCYEDWCLADRERLQRLYVRALGRLVQYHSERGEFSVAIVDAQRILACDPVREEVHRDLIRLYIAAEQPAAALQQYRTCVEVLKHELGVAPMRETSLLVQQCMMGSTHGMEETARLADEASFGSSAEGDPHSASCDLVLQVCRQLRDIATTLESVATHLVTSPQPSSRYDPSPSHEQRRMLAEVAAHLAPVVGVVKSARGEDRFALHM